MKRIKRLSIVTTTKYRLYWLSHTLYEVYIKRTLCALLPYQLATNRLREVSSFARAGTMSSVQGTVHVVGHEASLTDSDAIPTFKLNVFSCAMLTVIVMVLTIRLE